MSEKMFPIMRGDDIPWSVIAPHEAQAVANHNQTLKRLAERGGLSPYEALMIMKDERADWGARTEPEDDAEQLAVIVLAAQQQESAALESDHEG